MIVIRYRSESAALIKKSIALFLDNIILLLLLIHRRFARIYDK